MNPTLRCPLTLAEAVSRLQEEGFHPGSAIGDQVLHSAATAITTRGGLLLSGEHHVGKRRLARLIHRHGAGCDNPLVFISASDLNPRKIHLRLSSGGTLVLIELGEIEPDVQSALSEALSGDASGSLSRIISTTTIDFQHLIDSGRFDRGLFQQLSQIAIELPALRHRLSDMEILSDYFITRFRDSNRAFVGERLTPDALEKLRSYDWPGNLRQLQTVIRYALVTCPDNLIGAQFIDFSDHPI